MPDIATWQLAVVIALAVFIILLALYFLLSDRNAKDLPPPSRSFSNSSNSKLPLRNSDTDVEMTQAAPTSDFDAQGFRARDGAILGGALADNFVYVNRSETIGLPEPKFVGGYDEFVAKAKEARAARQEELEQWRSSRNQKAADPDEVGKMAWNLVKKCQQCGKPNAYTIAACNNCGTDLSATEISYLPNLFMGMIHGVDQAGPIRLHLSLRSETESMIVFDDPLCLSRCHILSVPTDVFVPDIRLLFVNPERGSALIQRMEDAAWTAIVKSFLAHEGWRRQALSSRANSMKLEELRTCVMKAFNLPPSQYQIHLQYCLPPLLPHHFGILQRGLHFVKDRHFPYQYVLDALNGCIAKNQKLPEAPEMPTDQFVASIKETTGLDYDEYYKKDMDNLRKSNALLANFREQDFEYAVLEGKTVINKTTGEPMSEMQAPQLDSKDKTAMQNQGRPFNAEGKPTGRFYTHSRELGTLHTFS